MFHHRDAQGSKRASKSAIHRDKKKVVSSSGDKPFLVGKTPKKGDEGGLHSGIMLTGEDKILRVVYH